MFERLERIAVAEFDLVAMGPVLVSSGKSNKTNPTLPDASFLSGRYGNGAQLAYVIPGSTIKGVIRNHCGDLLGAESESQLFGCIQKRAQKGKISFHDAYADVESIVSSVRHSTAIEPHTQSVKRNSLNNMQVIEKGTFHAGFRMVNFRDDELWIILNMLQRVNTGEVRFGGRKSRGFGFMNVINFSLDVFNGFNENLEPKKEAAFLNLAEAAHRYGKES